MLDGKLMLLRMHTSAFVREKLVCGLEMYYVQILFSSSDSCVCTEAGNFSCVLAMYYCVCPKCVFVGWRPVRESGYQSLTTNFSLCSCGRQVSHVVNIEAKTY